ncbi:mechanosensitive ion channel family protein [Pleurocapsales cyanobacterium LEGE 06147]|nr:mechanosensitive ion channel family protein [Pleurocapsales cyanobacterium LEGE 06147]
MSSQGWVIPLQVLKKLLPKGFALYLGLIVAISWVIFPVQAENQIPSTWRLAPNILIQNLENPIVVTCVRLDGRCLFEVADQRSALPERVKTLEQRLRDINSLYVRSDNAQLQIRQQETGNLRNIYVSVNDIEIRLLTITSWDAAIQGINITTKADQIVRQIEEGLKRSKYERQVEFLIRQGIIAASIVAIIFLTSWIISRTKTRLQLVKKQFASSVASNSQSLSTQLKQRQHWHVKEVEHRLLQMAQAVIWVGGILFILNLFPYTRAIPFLILDFLQIPLKIGIVGLGTYVIIRLSYALIARFNSALASNYLRTQEANRRLQLRIKTISGVGKGVVTISWIGVGILAAFGVSGVNIAPLLAGVGIVSVAFSLAAQNLIRDAINGFLIILEDQYAVGDYIKVGEVGGMVEKINLRITQLRDAEGQLITIPNSEIKIVANLSSNWARADLFIPVAYQTDVNKALELIGLVAEEMSHDSLWQENILESPQVLGVDNFGERGVMIRVWIKTEPLKQWSVSREFRRRIKVAFDEAGIPIPLPQQQVWFKDSEKSIT